MIDSCVFIAELKIRNILQFLQNILILDFAIAFDKINAFESNVVTMFLFKKTGTFKMKLGYVF